MVTCRWIGAHTHTYVRTHTHTTHAPRKDNYMPTHIHTIHCHNLNVLGIKLTPGERVLRVTLKNSNFLLSRYYNELPT